jgi:hypothetical protein
VNPESGRKALDELAHMQRGSGREPLPVWVLWTVVIGLMAMSLGALGVGVMVLTTRGDVDKNTASIAATATTADAVARKAASVAVEAARVARNLARTQHCLTVDPHSQRCLERVAGVKGPGGATGATGLRGKRGLAAIAKRGPRGRPGRDAPPPSREGVAQGFSLWCSRMLCVGRNGRDAPPVTREELRATLLDLCGGSCNGEDAPPPTQDQVDAACAAGLCPASTGPAGPAGPQGEQGPQGEPALPPPPAPCDPALGYVCQPPPTSTSPP